MKTQFPSELAHKVTASVQCERLDIAPGQPTQARNKKSGTRALEDGRSSKDMHARMSITFSVSGVGGGGGVAEGGRPPGAAVIVRNGHLAKPLHRARLVALFRSFVIDGQPK